jgi:hypothetical protein
MLGSDGAPRVLPACPRVAVDALRRTRDRLRPDRPPHARRGAGGDQWPERRHGTARASREAGRKLRLVQRRFEAGRNGYPGRRVTDPTPRRRQRAATNAGGRGPGLLPQAAGPSDRGCRPHATGSPTRATTACADGDRFHASNSSRCGPSAARRTRDVAATRRAASASCSVRALSTHLRGAARRYAQTKTQVLRYARLRKRPGKHPSVKPSMRPTTPE